tara:strand:+ start:197 stop:430 length:234 start_codon:yes stop_codon:yes gene_type:complete
MFENFSTALIQLLGFFGVFGFFVYQLLTDKKNATLNNSSVKPKSINPKKEVKSGFFGRRKKEVNQEPPINKKNRWFK